MPFGALEISCDWRGRPNGRARPLSRIIFYIGAHSKKEAMDFNFHRSFNFFQASLSETNGFHDCQPVNWGKWLSFYQILTLMFPFRSDNDEDEGTAKRRHLQKFIFSATLTLPKSFKRKGKEKKITSEEGLGKSRHIWLRVIEARDSINVFYQLLLKEWNDLNNPSFKTRKFAALWSVSKLVLCCFAFVSVI